MDTSSKTSPSTPSGNPTAALALGEAGAPALAVPARPRMCTPMRSEVRTRVGYAGAACGAVSLAGFIVGGIVVATVPMAPHIRGLVSALPPGVPLVITAALAAAYYLC